MERDYTSLHLRELAVFIAVCSRGSLTQAASDVGLTASGVSHALTELERYVGGRLLFRDRRPVTPTVLGTMVKRHADLLLKQAAALDSDIKMKARSRLINVRIGLIDSLAINFLPQLVRRSARHVDALSIVTDMNFGLRSRLANRNLDIALASGRLDDLDGMERYDILDEPLVLLLPKGAPYALDDLKFKAYAMEKTLIRSSYDSALGKLIERQLRRLKLEPPRKFALDSVDSVVALVAEGIGWALLPPTAVARSAAHLKAVEIQPFPGSNVTRSITLIARSDELGDLPSKMATLSARIIRDVYVEKFQRLMPWVMKDLVIYD